MAGKPGGSPRKVKLRPLGKVYHAFETGLRKAIKGLSAEERARLPPMEEFLFNMKRSSTVARGLYNSRITKNSIIEMAKRMRVRPKALKKLETPTIELLWLQSQRPRPTNFESPKTKAQQVIFAEIIEHTIPAIVAEMERVLGSGERLTTYLNIIKDQAEPLGKWYLRWPTKK